MIVPKDYIGSSISTFFILYVPDTYYVPGAEHSKMNNRKKTPATKGAVPRSKDS